MSDPAAVLLGAVLATVAAGSLVISGACAVRVLFGKFSAAKLLRPLQSGTFLDELRCVSTQVCQWTALLLVCDCLFGLGNLVTAGGLLASGFAVPSASPACQATAALLSVAVGPSMFAICMCCMYRLRAEQLGVDVKFARIPTGLHVILALVCLAYGATFVVLPAALSAFGFNEAWCWVSADFQWIGLMQTYLPVAVALLVSLACLAASLRAGRATGTRPALLVQQIALPLVLLLAQGLGLFARAFQLTSASGLPVEMFQLQLILQAAQPLCNVFLFVPSLEYMSPIFLRTNPAAQTSYDQI